MAATRRRDVVIRGCCVPSVSVVCRGVLFFASWHCLGSWVSFLPRGAEWENGFVLFCRELVLRQYVWRWLASLHLAQATILATRLALCFFVGHLEGSFGSLGRCSNKLVESPVMWCFAFSRTRPSFPFMFACSQTSPATSSPRVYGRDSNFIVCPVLTLCENSGSWLALHLGAFDRQACPTCLATSLRPDTCVSDDGVHQQRVSSAKDFEHVVGVQC